MTVLHSDKSSLSKGFYLVIDHSAFLLPNLIVILSIISSLIMSTAYFMNLIYYIKAIIYLSNVKEIRSN